MYQTVVESGRLWMEEDDAIVLSGSCFFSGPSGSNQTFAASHVQTRPAITRTNTHTKSDVPSARAGPHLLGTMTALGTWSHDKNRGPDGAERKPNGESAGSLRWAGRAVSDSHR